jgi:hypothetical protein
LIGEEVRVECSWVFELFDLLLNVEGLGFDEVTWENALVHKGVVLG